MRFQTLLTVGISHGYYVQGCQDFSFSFPADTMQLLKGGRLITRTREGKLQVLFEVNGLNPKISGQVLRIGLNLLNPFFSNFTNLNFGASLPCYSNTPDPKILNLIKGRILVGQIFSYVLKNTTRPMKIDLKDVRDRILQSDEFTASNDQSTISYNLTGQPAGVYQVVENGEATFYYADADLLQQSIFGVIEIQIDDFFYNIPPEFEIKFASKEETLKYYVIVRNYPDEDFINKLSIVDASAGRTSINFTKEFPIDDAISRSLPGHNDINTKIALFKSQTTVTRQENARQKIQLKVNGTELIPHLPQPSPNSPNSNLIIQLTKP
jgi:hypothetical protein